MKKITQKNNQNLVDHFKRGWASRLLPLVLLLSLFATSPGGLTSAPAQAASEAGDLAWTIYSVDAPKYFENMTDRSLVYDSNGRPHVAYGGDHLYYAWYDGSTWVKLTIDNNAQVGEHASIALDNDNNPRIAYYDSANRSLKFAYRLNNIWYTLTLDTPPESVVVPENLETVLDPVNAQELFSRDPNELDLFETEPEAASGDAGRYTSIAIGTDNRVHISYYYNDGVFGNLKYATWDGVTWSFQLADYNTTPSVEYDTGLWTSIAVKSNNLPCISYMDEKYDDLKYACSNGAGGWSVTNISEETGRKGNLEGVFTSLAFSSNNIPNISFLDFTTGGNYRLRHAYTKQNAWISDAVDNGAGIGYDTSIAFKPDNTLLISYYDANNLRLKYAVNDGGGWDVGAFNDGFNVGRFTSAAYDPSNRAGITFFSPDNGGYYYRHWNGSAWEASLIDESGRVGISTSLDISNGGFPHMSYFNDVGDDLKYATSMGNLFYTRELVTSGGTGEYSSIQLDSLARANVAYYDRTANDLRFIRWNGAWSTPLDIDGSDNVNVGQFVSMKIDNIGTFRLSYYDATNGDLRYAWGDGTNWNYTVLDQAGDVGKYSSIALDSGNRPTIAYYDATNKDLKIAYLSPTNVWLYETLDSVGDVGMYASIAISLANQVQITYYDATNGDLKFAYKTGNVWNFQVIDSDGDVGKFSSLAVDSVNLYSHVAYYDETNDDLKYAVRIGNSWFPEVVDSAGDVGEYASLALTPSGGVGISYFDTHLGDLKFAASYTLPSLTLTYLPLLRK